MNKLPAALLGVLLAFGLAAQAQSAPPGHIITPATTGTGGIVLPDFADLVDKYGPAVVNINTQARVSRQQIPGMSEDDPFYEFLRRFLPPDQRNGPRGRQQQPEAPKGPLKPYGLGSGFIVSADGFIVTNAHVVENAEEITVRLPDKREFKAKVVGSDPRSDVAVVKIDATGLPTVKIGDVSKLRVGEWVIAIGSPFGFTNSVTAGIVSAKSRDNLPTDNPNQDAVPFIQTDVAVNPGNSGGPLLNMKGEVVGINSQIYSRTGAFAGISFAIPIDYAYNVAEQIIKTGHVTRGRIGVGIQNVSRDVADSLGLPKPEGALVGNVEADSPADKAGVQVGDVIQKIDGRNIEGSADLSRAIRSIKPGQKVTLTVWRGGKARELPVTIAEFKDDADVPKLADNSKGKSKEQPKTDKLGLAVKELSVEDKKTLKIATGVMVEVSDGAAAAAQVGPGDVILRINNTEITSVKAFKETVSKLDLKKPVSLLIRDQDGQRFITFRPEAG